MGSPEEPRTAAADGSTPAGAVGSSSGSGSSPCPPVDTVLIRRLASDVAATDDVVAAWQQVEELRGELRRKDAELAAALEALAAAQAFGESPRAVALHRETAGQQLSRFLKDQLAARDEQLAIAQADAAAAVQEAEQLGAALAASQAECSDLRAQLGAAHAELHDAHAALHAAQGELVGGWVGALQVGLCRSSGGGWLING